MFRNYGEIDTGKLENLFERREKKTPANTITNSKNSLNGYAKV